MWCRGALEGIRPRQSGFPEEAISSVTVQPGQGREAELSRTEGRGKSLGNSPQLKRMQSLSNYKGDTII